MGVLDQPAFLNQVVAGGWNSDPRSLLDLCLRIESEHGRQRTVRWGPRTLDLDLLLFGDVIIDEPGLHLPHPRLEERSFVLEPLNELAPEMLHPALGLTVSELWARLRPIDGEDR